jgi:hypothetical protein
MSKSFFVPITAILFLLVTALTIPPSVQGGNHVRLRVATDFAGPVALAIGANGNGDIPEYGKDFSFGEIRSFASWKVVRLTSSGKNYDGMAVLQKSSGVFRVVLGPGTSFSKADTYSMPTDLVQYLNNEGMLYEPI